MTDWIDVIIPKVSIDDMPDGYRQIAEVLGVEAAVKLSREFGGLAVYIPQVDAVLRKKRDEVIRAEFNGRNYRDLAKKWSLTEVWIREIVDRKPPDQDPLF